MSSTDAKILKKMGGVGLIMTIIFTISVSLCQTEIFALFRPVEGALEFFYQWNVYLKARYLALLSL